MKEIPRYSGCFVCGDQNRRGLKARFRLEGDQAVTEVTADSCFEGYRGIYHGGMLATLLDEVMIKAILARQSFAVTAELTVRFLAPVNTGDRIVFFGRILKQKGRVFLTEGAARVGEAVVATATGKYLEAGPELKGRLLQSIDTPM